MNILFEKINPNIVPKWWMCRAYYDYQSDRKVMVMFPFHYLVAFCWWINYYWNSYRHKPTWIDKKLKKERYK